MTEDNDLVYLVKNGGHVVHNVDCLSQTDLEVSVALRAGCTGRVQI